MLKRYISILAVIIVIVTSLLGCSDVTEEEIILPIEGLSLDERVGDFEHLFKTIIENYPYLDVNKRMNDVIWEANYNIYLEKVLKTKTDEEFYKTLDNILKDLNNGHTNMLNKETVQIYRDGWYLAFQEHKWPNAWQILLLESLNNSMAAQRYGLEPLILGVENDVVEDEIINMEPVENAQVRDIIEDKIGYIYIPQMIQDAQREKDEELINSYLNDIKDYQALVIDIRGNGGGNSNYWDSYLVPRLIDREYAWDTYYFYKNGISVNKYLDFELEHNPKIKDSLGKVKDVEREKVPKLPPEVYGSFEHYIQNCHIIEPAQDSIRFQGDIYLLVDRYVYSSSEMLAAFSKDTGFATIIGEKTAGDGIGRDPWIEMLPNSGNLFSFPLGMGTGADGAANEEHKTTPDYEVQSAKRNTDFSEDQCIQKVLELEGFLH